MAKKIITGAEAPTEQVTQQFPDVPAPVAPEKVSIAEGNTRVAEYLAEVNADVAEGRDPKDNLDLLKVALRQWNTALLEARQREFAAMPIIEMFKEFINNPTAPAHRVALGKNSKLYEIRDAVSYVTFSGLDAANTTRQICPRKDWAALVRIFRYNIVRFSVRDDGKLSTAVIELTARDKSLSHEMGWDVTPTMRTLNDQLNEVTRAIIPGEICPRLMARADLKQLMRAVLPEDGKMHDTKVLIRNLATFEQKLFAVIKTRTNNGTYVYKDEQKSEDEDAAKNGPVEPQTADDDQTDDAGIGEATEEESAQA